MNLDRNDDEYQKIQAKVQEVLDMTDNQDEKVLKRFAEIRMKALSGIPEQATRPWFLSVPSLGVVTAMALVVLVTFTPDGFISGSASRSSTVDNSLDQLDVITQIEDLDMLVEHDFEFYIWLEKEGNLTQG